MENFCQEEFWNTTLTWNTSNPDFTPCFEKTVLVWIPCLFLWILAPIETSLIIKSRNRNIPWSWINISKLVSSVVIFVDMLVYFFFKVHAYNTEPQSSATAASGADFASSALIALTVALQLLFVVTEKKRGMQRSGILFSFWLLMVICFLPAFRTHILFIQDEVENPKSLGFIVFVVLYPFIIFMFLLNCFGDKEPSYLAHSRGKKPSPEYNASFLSVITFSWLDKLIWQGYRNPLKQTNLHDLAYAYSSQKIVGTWDKNWDKNARKTYNTGASKTSATIANGTSELQVIGTSANQNHYVSLLPILVRTFGFEFFLGSALKLISDLLQFTSPQILSLLIDFTEDKDEYMWKGFLYAISLLIITQIHSLFLGQYFIKMFSIGLKVRSAIVASVYKKALKISNSARKESTVGEIVNLMSVDAQRFMDLMAYLNLLWSAPLQIFLALFFLWDILGPATLAGLAVLIILLPVNAFIANRVKILQILQMKQKDARVKLMNEILNGIKVLKLYAWETSFEEQVLGVRSKEIKVLKQAAYLNASTSFVWTCAPFMVSLASFAVYSVVSETSLSPHKAFVSLALFNLLRFPIAMLPMLISNIVQASVSLTRMNKFMNSDELDINAVNKYGSNSESVSVDNGTFSWDKKDEKATLKGIDMKIKEGSLVGVVGSVGSGKSSLCSALLGEMDKISGTVNVTGSVAYVAQQAWIQNATLKDNILFGKHLNNSYYDNVIEACALKPDLAMLTGGDETEIGEKGINLSGGQKQRVSLGRAVYSQADVYILDDPLSAVDSHVGKHIFERVIGSTGLLKNKTRILVTHALTYLRHMDQIIVLKNGEVSEKGSFRELVSKKGEFQEFLLQYLSENTDEEEELEDLEEIKQELQQSIGKKEFARQISQISTRKRMESECSDSKSLNNVDGAIPMHRQVSTLSQSSAKSGTKTEEKKDEPGKKLIEEEKAETGRVSFGVYGYYIRAIGIPATILTVFFYSASQGFSVGSNVWLSEWSEDPTANETDVRNMYLGVYGALGVAQASTILIGAIYCYYGTFMAGILLHKKLLDKVLMLSMLFFDTNPIGRILNRFSKDVDVLDNQLPWIIRSWLLCLTQVIATLAIICYTTPLFIVVMIPTMAFYYFIQVMYVATSRQLKRIESVSRSPIYSHFGETVQGASTIRAYGKTNDFIKESMDRVDYNQISYYPSIVANRWLAIRLEFLGNILTFAAALFAVMSRDSITGGEVGLSITYALQVTATLNWLVRMSSEVETNIVSVERIKEYSETKPEAPWEIPQNKPHKDWPENGLVKFDKYSTRYREGLDLVVKKIDVEIKPTEKIGIVGRTGAGKSSLTLGLFRIVEPAEGTIMVDGVDIAKIGLHDLRSRLTIIPQDPVLFSGTLRINLDPFNVHSDEALWDALEHAHLKSFVSELSAGLQHEVAEGGENLSVGQRQLVCLARALLRKTKVLILDEATAAVDMETDDLIQQTIRREFWDCTVLTIAHRLNTIMDSTRVLVLERGEVKEFDTPSNLLKDRYSIFHSMAKDAGLI